MNLLYFWRSRLRLGFILLFLFSLICANANLAGRWVSHPAAALRQTNKYGQIDRIIEGERYVYFSVRGGAFQRGAVKQTATQFNIDPIQIFRYDKSLPWTDENIRPLAREFELSGILPVMMNYWPERGVFVVVYENRSIDFIYDDGTMASSLALKNLPLPGAAQPNAISFDPEKPYIYIGGSFGYIAVDLKSGEAVETKWLDKAVAWVGRVGENMVFFAGSVSPTSYSTNTYIYPVGMVPAKLENPVAGCGNLQCLMPLTPYTFAAMAPGANDKQNILKLFTIEGEDISSEDLTSTLTVDDAATTAYRHLFRTDGFVSEAKDGYAIHDKDAIYLLKKGTAEQDELLTRITKNGNLSDTEIYSKAATFDGSRVWLYTYDTAGINGASDAAPRGFYFYEVSGDTWGNKSGVSSPNAPTNIFSSRVAYNPKYGMLTRGAGSLFNSDDRDIDRLCSFKEGHWLDMTFASRDAGFRSRTDYALGIGSDPLDLDKIWGNTMFLGLHRIDLADYSKLVQISTKNYVGSEKTMPGLYAVLPTFIAWAKAVSISNVTFDNEGTMWFTQFVGEPLDDDELEYYSKCSIPLYHLTAEERQQLDNPEAARSILEQMAQRAITIKDCVNYHYGQVYALCHPANKNILAGGSFFAYRSFQRMFIYDHNGTPEDTSDDRQVVIKELFDDRGEKILYEGERTVYEDPDSGELWYCTSRGVYILTPTDLLDGGNSCRRVKYDSGAGFVDYPLEQSDVQCIVDDNAGRRWLASTEGLYCLEKATNKVLGQYTTENSGIPSNEVFFVAFNPENGAIWVVTARGVAEFYPEGSRVVLPEGNHLSVWPTAITPDYNGYVSISNADSVSDYYVCDKDGNVIKILGKAELSQLQWNLTDEEGARVKSGRYNIKRKDSSEKHEVVVM